MDERSLKNFEEGKKNRSESTNTDTTNGALYTSTIAKRGAGRHELTDELWERIKGQLSTLEGALGRALSPYKRQTSFSSDDKEEEESETMPSAFLQGDGNEEEEGNVPSPLDVGVGDEKVPDMSNLTIRTSLSLEEESERYLSIHRSTYLRFLYKNRHSYFYPIIQLQQQFRRSFLGEDHWSRWSSKKPWNHSSDSSITGSTPSSSSSNSTTTSSLLGIDWICYLS